MDNLILSFKAAHKALGGIETDVLVYDDKIILKRKVSGIISMNVRLPAETTAYYSELAGINFVKPSGLNGIGWIELVGISTSGKTMKTVDVNGKLINNVDSVNALGNPYCIAFNKDKSDMEKHYNRMKEIFNEYKANSSSGVNIINAAQEESALDKIKKLKELLDVGAISQEEFDEKKNSLMNNI